jgi:hypothetical protein
MAGKLYRGEVLFEGKRIRVEGPKEWVEEMIGAYSQTSKPQAKPDAVPYAAGGAITAVGGTERELVAEKRPRGHHEIVAVLAFALTAAGTSEFSEEDIRRAYIRAGSRPPKVVAQALRDAKNKYEYVEPSGTRGKYRLTNHGDRVVRFDLPRPGNERT